MTEVFARCHTRREDAQVTQGQWSHRSDPDLLSLSSSLQCGTCVKDRWPPCVTGGRGSKVIFLYQPPALQAGKLCVNGAESPLVTVIRTLISPGTLCHSQHLKAETGPSSHRAPGKLARARQRTPAAPTPVPTPKLQAFRGNLALHASSAHWSRLWSLQ